ncbi:MAG: hypothetical protein ACYCZN_05140 [Candidatus Dormibacteria bacterium]
MCFADDALPPFPPIRGGAPEVDLLVLASADGTRFSAYRALPKKANGAGIVILPDVRGLPRFYE